MTDHTRRRRYKDVSLPDQLVDMQAISTQLYSQRIGIPIARAAPPVYRASVVHVPAVSCSEPKPLVPVYDAYGNIIAFVPALRAIYDGHGKIIGYMN